MVPDKEWTHFMGYCLWYQTRGGLTSWGTVCGTRQGVELGLYWWGVGFLCNVLADLIVLTGGL